MEVERKKRGFAIVLVAALAGFVFLLGASLVAVTRLQTASANYDQRLRLAREHARAALEMAIGDLQQFAADDRFATYTADVYRSNTEDDFDVGATDSLPEPFWMGVSDGTEGGERWLVTRLFNPVDPDSSVEDVTLLGKGTVGSDSLEVNVPKESIRVNGVRGYAPDDEKTIGHYAYWVGDLGVKASYASYDHAGKTLHGIYGADPELIDGSGLNDRQLRLSQLRIGKPSIDFFDTNEGEGESTFAASNPLRIDNFVNDFQFRERYGSSSEDERFLKGLSDVEVRDNFHDFTPLANGLLLNASSLANEYREPVEYIGAVEGEVWDDNFQEYKKYYDVDLSISLDVDKGVHAFPITSVVGAPSLAPVMTQFNLNFSLYFVETSISPRTGDLYLSYNASCSLWNPYTCHLVAEQLAMRVGGLPHLTVWFDSAETASIWDGDLDLLLSPEFEFGETTNDADATLWRPGQIAVFSGPDQDETEMEETGTALEFGPEHVAGTDKRVVLKLNSSAIEMPEGDFSLVYSFSNDEVEEFADLAIELLGIDGTSEELLAEYRLDGVGGLYTALESENTSPLEQGVPTFGFSWRIGDSEYPLGTNYWPLNSHIPVEALSPFDSSADYASNVSPNYESAVLSIFGYNQTDVAVPGETLSVETEFDLPVFEIPKQEITSFIHFRNVYGSQHDPDVKRIGEPQTTSSPNGLLDDYFISTIPSNWGEGLAIANSLYEPLEGSTLADLTADGSAAHLSVRGAFNVHSTSIDAWESMLKSCSTDGLGARSLQYEVLEDDGEDDNSEWDVTHYLFFNLPQNAADVFMEIGEPETIDTDLEKFRLANRASVFALNEPEIRLLATYIVSNIRKRLQGSAPYVTDSGRFASLQEFIDSGVIENAILDFESDTLEGRKLTPDWADVEGTENARFTQSTVLSRIAPRLVTRSDTFLVRVYGDAVDPSDSSKIWARAYCEGIVQRVHEKVSEGSSERKLELVAFRWLSQSEI